jgi:hypothetical protein
LTHQVLSNDIEWNASQLNNEIDDESFISNIENELLKEFFFRHSSINETCKKRTLKAWIQRTLWKNMLRSHLNTRRNIVLRFRLVR